MLADGQDAAQDQAVRVAAIPLEAWNVEGYVWQRPREPVDAVRREAALVQRYAAWRELQGGSTCRQQIYLPGGVSLFTDLYDSSMEELVEAKADANRAAVREGFAQVLDYSRYVAHTTKALLLPARPSNDMLALLNPDPPSLEVSGVP